MNNLTENLNLKTYILDIIEGLIGHKLINNFYYDVCSEDQLTTNNNGIDIISNQLMLVFETKNPIFISWATINNWFQYSLCVSEKTFCEGVEKFTKKDKNWDGILGNTLIGFDVYGYKKNTIKTTETISGKSKTGTYSNAPHLLTLKFSNDKLLGIANFYKSDNFIPTHPMGDDIWIIFNWENIKVCIDALNLDKLEK